jgi:hypothetical protein
LTVSQSLNQPLEMLPMNADSQNLSANQKKTSLPRSLNTADKQLLAEALGVIERLLKDHDRPRAEYYEARRSGFDLLNRFR